MSPFPVMVTEPETFSSPHVTTTTEEVTKSQSFDAYSRDHKMFSVVSTTEWKGAGSLSITVRGSNPTTPMRSR
jgi:hypothetical protein